MVRETRARRATLAVAENDMAAEQPQRSRTTNSRPAKSRKRSRPDDDVGTEVEREEGGGNSTSDADAMEDIVAVPESFENGGSLREQYERMMMEEEGEADRSPSPPSPIEPQGGGGQAPVARKLMRRGRADDSSEDGNDDGDGRIKTDLTDDKHSDNEKAKTNGKDEEEEEEEPQQATRTTTSRRGSRGRGRGRGRGSRGRGGAAAGSKRNSRGKRKALEDDDDGEDDEDEDSADTGPPLPPPSQEPTRRSGRNRGPPKDSYTETLAQEELQPRSKPSRRGGRRKKMTEDELWAPENMATRHSPFTRIDLSQIFNQYYIENILTPEQRATLISFLPECDLIYPPTTSLSTPDPTPQIDHSLWNSPVFRDALAQWKNDLGEGKYEPEYIKKGEEARQRRMAGEFDNWKDTQFELYWGQKQKLEYDAVAGQTSKVKIQDMVKYGVFKIGDVFSMRRNFSGGVFVRKEAKLIDLNKDNGTMTFTYPTGEYEWEKDGVENKTISNVINITALETTLCKEHPDAPEKLPNGNAFKTIRVLRKGEDIGCVFDLRSKFYHQYLANSADGK